MASQQLTVDPWSVGGIPCTYTYDGKVSDSSPGSMSPPLFPQLDETGRFGSSFEDRVDAESRSAAPAAAAAATATLIVEVETAPVRRTARPRRTTQPARSAISRVSSPNTRPSPSPTSHARTSPSPSVASDSSSWSEHRRTTRLAATLRPLAPVMTNVVCLKRKPPTGPLRQDQNKVAQKKYWDKVKEVARAKSQLLDRFADVLAGGPRCPPQDDIADLRSMLVALVDKLYAIDPREAESAKEISITTLEEV